MQISKLRRRNERVRAKTLNRLGERSGVKMQMIKLPRQNVRIKLLSELRRYKYCVNGAVAKCRCPNYVDETSASKYSPS